MNNKNFKKGEDEVCINPLGAGEIRDRCKAYHERLGIHCILEKDHSCKHAFPNALYRKENPKIWDHLRRAFNGIHESRLKEMP